MVEDFYGTGYQSDSFSLIVWGVVSTACVFCACKRVTLWRVILFATHKAMSRHLHTTCWRDWN